MRIKCLAQGNNILLPGFEPSFSVSKTDILANRPIQYHYHYYYYSLLPNIINMSYTLIMPRLISIVSFHYETRCFLNDIILETNNICSSKFLVGDVTAAVRIIASDDSVITPTSEVVTALRLKHPPSPHDLRPPPTEPVTKTSSVSEEEVMVALKSFRPSSAGGVDGLRPGHLKDLVAPQTAEAGRRLMKALANLCSKLLLGQVPQHARDLLFAANLTALRKKDGGIRPIAVGNVFRRLASKIAAKRVIPELRRQLPLVQLGVGVSGGCEDAAHAVRAFVQSSVVHENNVLIKFDMQNAFNTVRRDHFLEVCSSRAPSILHLASTAYATSSHLVIGNETILSETGVNKVIH